MSDGPITLPVLVGRGAMAAERAFERTRSGEGNKANYTLKIKACNPSCI